MDNRKLIREMARLGGTTFNIEADRIRDEASKGGDEAKEQEDKLNTIFEEGMRLEYDMALVMNEVLLTDENPEETTNEEVELEVIDDEDLVPDYVIPSVFDKSVAPAVADAVKKAATASGVSRR